MKKLLFVMVVAILVSTFFASPVLAGKPDKGEKGIAGQSGNSGVSHLELWEKDANWDIVTDGAWGKMKYDADSFVFNGHGLVAGTDYVLINYSDPWPGTGSAVLASGTADSEGNLHLSGGDVGTGKIWLVLASDFDTDHMTGWNPADYLFEHHLIP